MTFYILLNQITTIFLSLNLLTTLSFESEIKSFYYGGSKEDVFIKETDNKTLLLKPYRTDGLSNLLVVTLKRKYYFQLAYDASEPHTFVEVRHGLMNHAQTKKAVTESYEIWEGSSSILFVNKSPAEVNVNGIKVKKREYVSKGVPVFLNGKRILN